MRTWVEDQLQGPILWFGEEHRTLRYLTLVTEEVYP
jgi:hypothetical protein